MIIIMKIVKMVMKMIMARMTKNLMVMKIVMAIMMTNVKMMTMMMDENIATCGGAGLGECPLAVQTEAGIPSTIQIQPPLPSDKDDDNTNDDVLRMMITIMLRIVKC